MAKNGRTLVASGVPGAGAANALRAPTGASAVRAAAASRPTAIARGQQWGGDMQVVPLGARRSSRPRCAICRRAALSVGWRAREPRAAPFGAPRLHLYMETLA